jgi:peptide/nickel transport system permease protein
MASYIIRRILLLIPTVFVVTIIVFLLARFIPGNAVDIIQSQLAATESGAIDRAAIEHELGLDVPIPIQYIRWVGGILHSDFGKSLHSRQPVLTEVLKRLPVTFELGLMALIIGTVISLSIGLVSALRQDSWIDYSSRTLAILMLSIPGFFVGTLIMILPSRWWNWSPPMEIIRFTDDPLGNLGMFLLPALVLSFQFIGGTMRVTRTMMLEVLRQDYIRTAWAKGLPERVIVIRHTAKNALIPVFTMIGLQIPLLLGGAIIVEQIFVLPGIGRLMYQSLTQRDYPIISAINLLIAISVMVVNLSIDIFYGWLDPRVSYK